MSGAVAADTLARRLEERVEAGRRFFGADAERLARLCHRMAERFARGGRLIALGATPAARSDARHVAVEFVHPVIVGKRALPALALGSEGGPLRAQVELLARPDDIAMAFGAAEDGGEAADALAVARERGCLTVGFADVGSPPEPDPELVLDFGEQIATVMSSDDGVAGWLLVPPSDDPFVRQELVETTYHVLWELVHVFFEHRGLLAGREARNVHDTGASSFLYPFLGEQETDLGAVLADVRASALMKADEIGALRTQTLEDGRDVLLAAAAALRRCFDGGGKLLALGNGGSATDAMDAVADFRAAPQGWRARAAIDLAEDSGIVTAVGNDVGVEKVFQRQVIAYGQPGDVLLAFSTSGTSTNVIEALVEARRRELVTVAMVGYDGGRVAAEGLADHVVITRSEHIPRIQEAQASAYHVLRELVELLEPAE